MSNVIEIVIKATDNAGSKISGLANSLKAIGVLAIAKKVSDIGMELGNLALQAGAAKARFEAFAGGAQQAANILAAVQAATGGTIDQMGAMTSSTKLLSMGLASSADEVATLTNMAIRLGDQTMTTGDRVNDFALLLANQSVMRLDNFGISSGRVRARILELQEAMPGLSRETAFMQATVEIGTQSLDKLGDAGLAATGKVASLDAATKDLKVTMGEILAPTIADTSGKAATFLRTFDKSAQIIAYARKEYGYVGGTLQVLGSVLGFNTKMMRDAALNSRAAAAGNAALAQGYSDVGVSARKAAGEIDGSGVVVEYLTRRSEEAARALHEVTREVVKFGKSAEASATQVSRMNTILEGSVGNEMRQYAESNETLAEKQTALRTEIDKLEGSHSRATQSVKDYITTSEKISELEGEYTALEEDINKLAEEHRKAMGSIILGFAQAEAAADGVITKDEYAVIAGLGVEYGLWDQATATAIDSVKSEFDALNGKEQTALETVRNIVADTNRLDSGKVDRYGEAFRTAAKKAKELDDKLIDLASRSIVIDIEFNIPEIPHGQIGTVPEYTPTASGFDGWVTGPRLFLAGEAGPEHVKVTPRNEVNTTYNNSGGDTFIINNNAQAAMIMDRRARVRALAGRF